MAKQYKPNEPQRKQIRAWGIRRKEVDTNQLALVYYLLARRRIEERHEREGQDPSSDAEDGRAA